MTRTSGTRKGAGMKFTTPPFDHSQSVGRLRTVSGRRIRPIARITPPKSLGRLFKASIVPQMMRTEPACALSWVASPFS